MNNHRFLWMAFVACLAFVPAAMAQNYDVEVKLVRMKCLKVVEAPFDSEEDIHGGIHIPAYKIKDAGGVIRKYGCCYMGAPDANYVFRFFDLAGPKVAHATADPVRLGLNESRTFNTFYVFRNITKDQLLSLEFGLGGTIYDDDLITVKYQNCNECGTTYRNVRMSDFTSQINTIAAGSSKLMKVGSDNILELNFYEGDSNSSHIQCQFTIKVIRK